MAAPPGPEEGLFNKSSGLAAKERGLLGPTPSSDLLFTKIFAIILENHPSFESPAQIAEHHRAVVVFLDQPRAKAGIRFGIGQRFPEQIVVFVVIRHLAITTRRSK